MSRFTFLSIIASAFLFLSLPSCGGDSSSSSTDGAPDQASGSGGNGGGGGGNGAGGQMDAGVDNILPATECRNSVSCDTQDDTCETVCDPATNRYRTCTCRTGFGADAGLSWQCQNRTCGGNDGGFQFDAGQLQACPTGACTGFGQPCTGTNGNPTFCQCQNGTWDNC